MVVVDNFFFDVFESMGNALSFFEVQTWWVAPHFNLGERVDVCNGFGVERVVVVCFEDSFECFGVHPNCR